MCGIWALFGHENSNVKHCDDSFTRIQHRGPDAWRIQVDKNVEKACVGFARLEIVDSVYGMQPMILHKYPHLTTVCNGELYNFRRLGEELKLDYETRCDVECIPQIFGLYEDIEKTVQSLDGVFAFTLIDSKNRKIYIARDPFGVRPLYIWETSNGMLGVCSEGKGLAQLGKHVLNGHDWSLKQFPPSHYYVYDILQGGKVKLLKRQRYYKIGSLPKFIPYVPYSSLVDNIGENIRTLFTGAIRKRLMSDRRLGCLLSGGLDSSLTASLLAKLAKEANLPYKIQTFSIGLESSPDLIAARQVAKLIGTEHHEVIITEEKVAQVLDDIIATLETCDITTIRASIGMYLIAQYIKAETDTTVIFSGEGADELCQGYIYFREAPNDAEAHKESLRLLSDIYHFDGLRADRTVSRHGLELRVPFLDLQFTQYFLSLPPHLRQPKDGVEKYLLRHSFRDAKLLPDNILWRHKEAFSDGMASSKKSLFTVIQEIVDKRLPSEALKADSYEHLPPPTKEALYYRMVFEKEFPGQAIHLTPYYWMPKWTNASDPSARFLKSYAAETQSK